MNAVATIFATAAVSAFRPVKPVQQWCQDAKVPMIENRTHRGEPYDFDKNGPFMATLVFGFFGEKWSRELICMKDSQSMFTTGAVFSVAWMLANCPGNVIYVTNTRDQVREFGKDRFGPIFDAVPELRIRSEPEAVDARGSGKAIKGPESTAQAWRFPGGVLYLGGGQSVSALVGTTAAWVILDEVSKHPFVNNMTTVDLGRSRVTGDDDSKIMAFSTPEEKLETVKDPKTGKEKPVERPETVIHMEFLSGTQERCEVPCPHCGHWQALEFFEGLRFDHWKVVTDDGEKWNLSNITEPAWYRCANPACTDRHPDGTVRGRIEESVKRWWALKENHRWTATNPSPRPGRRSAQISALYNIAHKNRSWTNIALAWLDAKRRGQQALKSFYTDILGLPFEPYRVANTAIRQIERLKNADWRRFGDRQQRERNTVLPWPKAEVEFIALRADIQSGFLKWQINAFAADGRMHVLDWSETGELEDLRDLVDARRWTAPDGEDGEEYQIASVWIDTGHQTRMVYQFIARMVEEEAARAAETGIPPCIWEGVRGMARENSKEARVQPHWVRGYPVIGEGGLPTGQLVTVNNLDSDYWEAELYVERIHHFDPKNPREDHPAIILPGDTSEEFMAELCNMHQVMRKGKNGRMQYVWEKIRRGANDQGDLLKYGCAQWYAYVAQRGAV